MLLGVCGTDHISPGRLVLSVAVRTPDVRLMKVRQNNVIPDLPQSTWRVWSLDLTKQHDLKQPSVQHPANMSIPPKPLTPQLEVHGTNLTHWQYGCIWTAVSQSNATKVSQTAHKKDRHSCTMCVEQSPSLCTIQQHWHDDRLKKVEFCETRQSNFLHLLNYLFDLYLPQRLPWMVHSSKP